MYILQQSTNKRWDDEQTWETMESYGVELKSNILSDLIWMLINAEYNPDEFRGREFRIVEETKKVVYRTLE